MANSNNISPKKVFIVRPFGVKEDIDFDEVERKLIVPALQKSEHIFAGGSAQRIMVARDIREDLFEELLQADLVIADLSIHSANVFYELGVRHAFKKKHTVLIRCDKDEVPFDLKLLRYLEYDKNEPAKQVDSLTEMIDKTLETGHVDSPAFKVLPHLHETENIRLEAVPTSFTDDVELAAEKKRAGDLALFHEEIKGLPWEDAGQRQVAENLFKLGKYDLTRPVWERVLEIADEEGEAIEALDRLSTIYQRIGMLPESDQMLERLLGDRSFSSEEHAESLALMGRNQKERWLSGWRDAPQGERREQALKTNSLEDAYRLYREAFTYDLNNYWAGQNALTLVLVQVELAKAMPAIWELGFDSEEEAEKKLIEKKKELEVLTNLVEESLKSGQGQEARSRYLVSYCQSRFVFINGHEARAHQTSLRNCTCPKQRNSARFSRTPDCDA